jgi:hypothetical protein
MGVSEFDFHIQLASVENQTVEVHSNDATAMLGCGETVARKCCRSMNTPH